MDQIKIGKFIADERKRKGYTQKKLSEKDITSQPTLTMYMLVAIIEYNARINHQYL